LANLRLRDRDAIITKEGLIFRVLGYIHPDNAYVCDVEYAPGSLFKSDNPKAFRGDEQNAFYKFFEDDGWRFIQKNFLQYMIFHEMLQKRIVGVNQTQIVEVKQPAVELEKLVSLERKDELVAATCRALNVVTQCSGLFMEDFGVFGSMLHGFHNSRFSDIDLIVYGRDSSKKLREALQYLYEDDTSAFRNEFETDKSVATKNWRFQNLTLQEYVWHQRRKMIYALFNDEKSRRTIKSEFEPVKNWSEIINEYNSDTRMVQRGWARMVARVTDDSDSPFIPSTYGIEPLEVLDGPREALEAERIVSYLEEYRMQVHRDEVVYVEGNLEEVISLNRSFHQITLTYCPRYYEQVLKNQKVTDPE